MSSETILTDPNGNRYSLDNLATQQWLNGHCSGLDQCCAWLEQKALDLFAKRRVDDSLAMRAIADEMRKDLRPQMVKRAEEHEREFPSEFPEDESEQA